MNVVTAWIPLVDTDLDNGCLWVLPGSHRWGLFLGEKNAYHQVVTKDDVERRGEPVPVPMHIGDVLLFTNLTFHASRLNRSERMRWSLDCRFHPTRGYAPLGDEEAAGYDLLYKQWSEAAVVPVAVRSRRGGQLPDFAQWQTLRKAAAVAIKTR